jgi:tetratricopeptide (TPR) repeat protein
MARVFGKLNEDDKSLSFSEKAYKQDPSNKFYGLFLADLYVRSRRLDEAAKIYQNILQQGPENAEYGVELAAIHILNGKFEDAIKAYDKLEKALGISDEVIRQKQSVLLRMRKLDEAIKEGDRLIASDPTEVEYLQDQAELLMNNGKTEKAIPYIEKALQIQPDLGEAHLMLAEIFREKGDAERAGKEMEKALLDNNLDSSLKAQALVNYVSLVKDDQATEKAIKMMEGLIKTDPTEGKYHAIMGDLLVRKNRPAEARSAYLKAARFNKNVSEIWTMVIKLDSDLNQVDSMLVHTEEAIEVFPNHAVFWYQNGAANLIKKKYDRAIEALEEARRLAPDKFELNTYIYAGLGDAYNALAKHERSDDAYEEALKADPNNDHVMNNYSYFLSLRKSKLNRAVELSSILAEKHPSNGTYLDTHGWVLFVNQEFERAKPFLEKAAQLKPKSGIVQEHFGDVLYKLGEKEKAVEIWKRAKTIGGVTPDIDKKIMEGKI